MVLKYLVVNGQKCSQPIRLQNFKIRYISRKNQLVRFFWHVGVASKNTKDDL